MIVDDVCFWQEYYSGLPFPPLEDLPNPGIEPSSPALAGRFFTTKPPRRPWWIFLYGKWCREMEICLIIVKLAFDVKKELEKRVRILPYTVQWGSLPSLGKDPWWGLSNYEHSPTKFNLEIARKKLAAPKIEADVRCKQLWPGKFNKIPIFKLLL